MKRIITEYINENIQAKKMISVCDIERIAKTIICSLKKGGTVYWMGNGGSAADAQHLSCELVSKFRRERKALSSVSLTTNTSILTAVSNDYSFDDVFYRQVQALVKPVDVVVGISTSGTSRNIVKAMKEANFIGAVTIAFTGRSGGVLSRYSDFMLCIPSDKTSIIQECHIMAGHIICMIIEDELT
jgi:D-sedoheptulose 7-phosphate isomerase